MPFLTATARRAQGYYNDPKVRRTAFVLFTVACLWCSASTAQEPTSESPVKIASADDYARTMKELRTLDGELRNNIEEVARADLERMLLFDATMNARKQAARIEELLGAVLTFWEARKSQDAVSLARSAVAEAGNISKALAVIDLESPSVATVAQQRLDKICASCHTSYREQRPDGSYRIK
jgi:hypothetical protein